MMISRESTTRPVAAGDDMDHIYMMGYDTWRGNLDRDNYLRSCQNSQKYQDGSWFVLEVDTSIVASMIVYEGGFDMPVNSLGFGSIATHPPCRGRGYARTLIRDVLNRPDCQAASAIYLHSDIDPSFYEVFGFVALGESPTGVTCMIRPRTDISLPMFTALPAYF